MTSVLNGPPRREFAPTPLDAFEKLAVEGWAILPEASDAGFCEYVTDSYFNREEVLQPEQYDIFPPDRLRASGALMVTFGASGELFMQDMPRVSIQNEDRGVSGQERRYPQLPLASDERLCRWLGNIARLIPTPFDLLPDMQDAQAYPHKYWRHQHRFVDGWHPLDNDMANLAPVILQSSELPPESPASLLQAKVGVHYFETHGDVVSGYHQDMGADYVTSTGIARCCEGGQSLARRVGSADSLFEGRTLIPGQTLVLDNKRLEHTVTPLKPVTEGCWRRVIVTNFNFVRNPD